MNWLKILLGFVFGNVLGFLNAGFLAFTVRKSVQQESRKKAILVILGSYLCRYLIIALLVVWLFKRNESGPALAVLAGLLIMTQISAVRRQRKSTG